MNRICIALLLGSVFASGTLSLSAASKVRNENFRLYKGAATLASRMAQQLREKVPALDVIQQLIVGEPEFKDTMELGASVLETVQALCDSVASSRSIEELQNRFTFVYQMGKLLVTVGSHNHVWKEAQSENKVVRLLLAAIRLRKEITEEHVLDFAKVYHVSESTAQTVFELYEQRKAAVSSARDAHRVVAEMFAAVKDCRNKEGARLLITILTADLFRSVGANHGWFIALSDPNQPLRTLVKKKAPALTGDIDADTDMMLAFDTEMLKSALKLVKNRKRLVALADTLTEMLLTKAIEFIEAMSYLSDEVSSPSAPSVKELQDQLAELRDMSAKLNDLEVRAKAVAAAA